MLVRLLLTTLLAAACLPAQGTTRQAAVEIENAWVRVLRVKQAPHEKSPSHRHPASVVVYLTDVRQRVNGMEVTRKAGDVAWLEAATHTEENLSDQPLEFVQTELKPGAPPSKGWPVSLDPVKLDPVHHLVPFENSRVRVLRTILEPHLQGPKHDHPAYVVVYLTELHTTMTLADGKRVDNPRRPGDVAWRDAYTHTTENVGDRTAVEIQIELK
jgi:quercetin dioxygenase-like cupin family protein